MQTCFSSKVPHQVAGGEKGVSAVQHASAAAGTAGGQHRGCCASTTAPARHREPGVAALLLCFTHIHSG